MSMSTSQKLALIEATLAVATDDDLIQRCIDALDHDGPHVDYLVDQIVTTERLFPNCLG